MSRAPTPSPLPAASRPAGRRPGLWPTAGSGWLALVAAAIGLGSWVVLPIVTTVFGRTYPVTDTVVMPIIGLVLVLLAAIINVAAFWLGKQRSILNTAAVVLTVGATVFFGTFVIGEGLGGV